MGTHVRDCTFTKKVEQQSFLLKHVQNQFFCALIGNLFAKFLFAFE